MTRFQYLKQQFGKVWNTKEFARDFLKIGHVGRLVTVVRRADQVTGSLIEAECGVMDSNNQTFYHSFKED